MSEPVTHDQQVRVLHRIEVSWKGSTVTADPGVFDAGFLCDMLGEAAYRQAYADGRLEVVHEG